MRTISAEEYDAAVIALPDTCPLVLIGDRRSGRQLLADAAKDLDQPFSAIAASRSGMTALQAVAALLERASAAT